MVPSLIFWEIWKARNKYKYDDVLIVSDIMVEKVLQCTRHLNFKLNINAKNEIAKTVESELEKTISVYGYKIVETLITEPDEHVKRAMNEINAELLVTELGAITIIDVTLSGDHSRAA
ncbi:hypothetical protein GIB67_017444 [Kingdonia uniflora]|uniref:Uncharacterized protein n=1 Tax=Kingdonia uniflora TaxID=39325 RepID=A0A7J7M488_9MAGN|nr:hypothetical protein GIB67_017444 [Kingdonia uniflora]